MIGRRHGVSLLVGLVLWAPPLGAQDSWVVDRAALGRLSKSFEQGPVVGRLVERTPDNYVFIPDSPELPENLPVLSPVEIPDSLYGARLRLWGTYDATGRGLLVQRYEWARSLDLGPQLAIAQTPGVGADAPAIAGKGFEQPSEATGGSVQNFGAIYGEYNVYPSWRYEQIFINSKSVVALAEPGQQSRALCSGVLIARDLVLTAGNCFKQHDPQDLQVWFGFVETAGGELPPPLAFDITELVAPPSDRHDEFLARIREKRFDADVLDYAVLRIDLEDGSHLSPDIGPVCLRGEHIRRGRSVYLVGHPKGFRQHVHDAGRVYLPFRQSQRQFETLKREIEIDFRDLEDGDRLQLLEQFVASYIARADGATTVFELHDTRFGGQPKLGIVVDGSTSGSPVFDHTDHCIVGILMGGPPDLGQRLDASWLFHHSVLPMPAILADLAQHPKTAALLLDGLFTIR